MRREVSVWVTAVVWFGTVAGAFWLWERYETTPGLAREPAPAVAGSSGCWQLTLFAHPHCPCTRASLRELAEISRAAPELSVRVVFIRPGGATADWERGESWDAARRIPGAAVTYDVGSAARRFGAETSGHAVLTNPEGRVTFRGGLTPARGRGGESVGRRAVLAWVGSGNGDPTAPVFGCPLLDADE